MMLGSELDTFWVWC